MKLTFRPVTPALWPALVDLFEDSPVCARCWCMYWRTGNAYRRTPAASNKAAFHAVVQRGPPPGLLAFDGRTPVAWVQLTPRAALPWLDRKTWRLERVDDVPVWSISCFYVRKTHRKRGITTQLIRAAIKRAKRARAPALEAYPLDRTLTPSATSTGVVTTFRREGFDVVARRFPPRPIMRHRLRRAAR